MVLVGFRSEARSIPNLLVAPDSPPATTTSQDGSTSPDRYERNLSGAGGYYADGAYVAVPDSNTNSSSRAVTDKAAAGVGKDRDVDLDPDPQEAYYVVLLHRFTALRRILQSQPPAAAVTASSISGDIIHYSIRKWRWVLLHRQPAMTLLSQLSQESVINGLAALESILQRGELRKNGGQQLGAWAWGLLAKCREVGQMGSEEVGVLRGLGKRAWWVLREIQAGIEEGADEEEDTDEEGADEEADGEGIENGVADGLEDEIDERIEGRVEEGEIQSEAEQQGSGDKNAHDGDGEKAHSPASATNVTSDSFQDVFTTAVIDQTIIISPAPGPSKNPVLLLLSEPPNGHQDPSISPPPQAPSSSTHPSSSDPHLMTAAQQRLLERLLLSPSSSPQPPARRPPSTSTHDHPTPLSAEEQQQQRIDTVVTETESESESDKQLRLSATLDMILTVVGERYGQRDLLIGRGFWGE